MTETSYDRVAYPSHVYRTTNPERIAAIAALHGVRAADPRGARVLEIGGGDGVNLMAIAAAFPGCEAHCFDLSHAAIERGQALLAASGLSNVTLRVDDIFEAAARYPAGSFDYVIAHGVYAWVPAPVRLATLALIRHALAPQGVAFVSYNALPGSHIRLALREMLLPEIMGIADPQARLARVFALLREFAESPASDDGADKAMRSHARAMLARPGESLFHDELNEHFEPQGLIDLVRESGQHGLAWLSEAAPEFALEGLVRGGAALEDDPDMQVIRAAFHADYRSFRYFRQSLLVHGDTPRQRQIDGDRAADLHCTVAIRREADGQFAGDGRTFGIADPEINGWLTEVTARAAAAPARHRFAVSELASTPAQRIALIEMMQVGVTMFAGPAPYVLAPGERPRVSALARAQARRGGRHLATLDHSVVVLEPDAAYALVAAADGSRTAADLETYGSGLDVEQGRAALRAFAEMALLEP